MYHILLDESSLNKYAYQNSLGGSKLNILDRRKTVDIPRVQQEDIKIKRSY